MAAPALAALLASVRRVDKIFDPFIGTHTSHTELRRVALGGISFGIAFLADYAVYPSPKTAKDAAGNLLVSARIAVAILTFTFPAYFVWPAIIRAGIRTTHSPVILSSPLTVAPFLEKHPSTTTTAALHHPDSSVLPAPIPPQTVTTLSTATERLPPYDNGVPSSPQPVSPTTETATVRQPDEVAHTFIEFDEEVCRVALIWCAAEYSMRFLGVFLAGTPGGDQAIILTYIVGFSCVLRPAATRWNRAEGRYFVRVVLLRVILPGLPLANAPVILMPALVEQLSAPVMVLIYPMLLSVVEYLFVSQILHNSAVERFTDEQFSVIARLLAAAIEASRVGIIVIMSNATDDFSGLVLVTLLSSVLYALASNDLYMIGYRWFQRHVIRHPFLLPANHRRGRRMNPTSLNPALPRFKRVYISCKAETLPWTGYILGLIKISGFGHYNAIEEGTGHLVPELVCDWAVIVVVVLGVGLAVLLSNGVRAGLRKWAAPRWVIDVPPQSVQPSNSAVFHMMMWIMTGAVVFYGFIGMTGLVKALHDG